VFYIRQILAIVIVLLTLFVTAITSAAQTNLPTAKASTTDIKFSPKSTITITFDSFHQGKCYGNAVEPCDIWEINAPFTCSDCANDFADAFTNGLNVAMLLATGDQCSATGSATGTSLIAPTPMFSFVKSSGAANSTVYNLLRVFSSTNGQNVFLNTTISIHGKRGLLQATGTADFSTLSQTGPVSLIFSNGETTPDADDMPVPGVFNFAGDTACIALTPTYHHLSQ
jgi:hypothetical protein